MARYVYHCDACRKDFEIDKPMLRANVAEPCPSCGEAGKRVYTAPGIQVKGAKVKFDSPKSECRGCEHGCCDLE